MQNDPEIDVLVARIECESWRDRLRTDPTLRGDLRADARHRFEQAKETLRRANHAAHIAGVAVPLRPDQKRAADSCEPAAAA